jgi:phage N-6-adenine-methyltransferase
MVVAYTNHNPQPVLAVPAPKKAMSVLGSSAKNTEFNGSDEWYTPQFCIDMAREVLGHIDLDPASSFQANFRVHADHYFTAEEDGLSKPWTHPYGGVALPSKIWLNPPNSLMTRFAKKIVTEIEAGHVESMIVVINTRCDTGWFIDMFKRFGGYFTRGRVGFEKHNAETGELISSTDGGAPTGQVFFYHGPDREKFVSVFSRYEGYYVPPESVTRFSGKKWRGSK